MEFNDSHIVIWTCNWVGGIWGLRKTKYMERACGCQSVWSVLVMVCSRRTYTNYLFSQLCRTELVIGWTEGDEC